MTHPIRIDLHVHTTASDGQFSPMEVVRLARDRRLNYLAITDHDTTDGVTEAQAAAQVSADHPELANPIVIPGIELSAEDVDGDVHMLGYYLHIDNTALQTRLSKFRQDRAERARKMVEKLNGLGMEITFERVLEIAAGSGKRRGAIGRPHVARAMIEKGYADSIPDAFNRYLNPGAPGYVARERLSPEGAIALIHESGGAAVLAHPAKLKDYHAMIKRLAAVGLDGVEVVHPSSDERTRLDLRGLAAQHNLLMTGGSDFHNTAEDGSLSIGSLTPPEDAPRLLKERAARYST
ncbi:MAG: PHP domain-containing protein [Anaerolineae bacterium]